MRYLQLAHNERNERGVPVARVIHNFGREDRLTQAVTIFALLELHKKGEATWEQERNFGPIVVSGKQRAGREEPGGGAVVAAGIGGPRR